MESLPPALRVHTDADASVQGITAATRKPSFSSPESNVATAKATKGSTPKFIRIANNVPFGRRSPDAIADTSNGSAMANSTVATIAFFNHRCVVSSDNCASKPTPMANKRTSEIRNHCFLRKSFKVGITLQDTTFCVQ